MKQLGQIARREEMNQAAQAFSQLVRCQALAMGDPLATMRTFQTRFPNTSPRYLELIKKTAVAPGTTAAGGWGDDLAPLSQLAAEFIAYIRPLSVIGRMTGVRRVPFMVKVPRAMAGASLGWIGQGIPAPVSGLTLNTVELSQSKVSGIAVFTDELLRSSDPAADAIVQNDFARAVVQFTDQAFLDPDLAEIADTSPSSITYGASSFASSGTDIAEIDADLANCISVLAAGNINFLNPYWVMSPSSALILAMKRDTSGNRAFPGVSVAGGNLLGIPVLTSASAGNVIVLIDAAEVLLADGGLETDVTNEAAIQMDDTPDNPTTASTVAVSLWQRNLTGIRCTRYIRWALRRPGAVSLVTAFGGT